MNGIIGKFDIIYTDPPWSQQKGNVRKCRPKQNKNLDYPTMTVEKIESMHRDILSFNSYEKHNVFMWTIDKFLTETELMMQRLGYKLHARLIWDKTNGVAPAFTVRFTHEYLLWFYLPGKMLMPDASQRGKFTTVLRESSTIHSKKPECAYEMIENMFPRAKKIELFARQNRSGWYSWGNEISNEKDGE